MMNRMSFSETVFLFFLALIIFGPKKLPEIARQAGKLLNEFRRASNEFKSQIEQEIAHLEVENKGQSQPTILPPSPPPAGTASRTLNAAPSAASPAESSASETAATLAASDDEPLFASNTGSSPTSNVAAGTPAEPTEPPVATEALPADPVTSPTSRESHV